MVFYKGASIFFLVFGVCFLIFNIYLYKCLLGDFTVFLGFFLANPSGF